MRIATSPLAIVIAHSRASTFAGTHISLADYFLGSRSSSLRPCFLANSTPLNHRAFSKPYSSSSSRPGKQLAALNVKPQQKSAPRATTNTVDDVEFPMADQYKYIAHLLTMPIRTPEATRKAIFEQLKDVTEEEYFKNHPRTSESCTGFMVILGKNGRYDEVAKFFQTAKDSKDVPITLGMYCSMISACAVAKKPQEAFQYLEQMRTEGIVPNDAVFAALVNVCANTNRLHRAMSLLKEMKELNIEPTTVIYTTLIKGCIRANNIPKAWEIWQRMISFAGLKPDSVTYSLMIHACAKTGEAEKAIQLLKEMQEGRMLVTEVTYNSLLHTLAHRRDYYKECFRYFDQMKSVGYQPDRHTFNAMLTATAHTGDIIAMRLVLKEMAEEKIELDKIHYSTQLYCFANAARNWNAHRTQILKDADAVFQEMMAKFFNSKKKTTKEEEGAVAASPSSPSSPPIDILNNMLQVFSRSLFLNRAEKFFEEIKTKYHAKPDRFTLSIMCRMYMASSQPLKALSFFDEMRKAGYHLDRPVLMGLLNALANKSYMTRAIELLKEMHGQGIIPKKAEVKVLHKMALLHNLQRDVENLLEPEGPLKAHKLPRIIERSKYAQRPRSAEESAPELAITTFEKKAPLRQDPNWSRTDPMFAER